MNHRYWMSMGAVALAIVFVVVLLAPLPAGAQGTQVLKAGPKAVTVANDKGPAKPYVVPKTPDGVPDLQGYWTNNTITPLQRPNGVTKEFYTKEEFLEAAKKQAERDGEEATPGTVEDVHYDHTQFALDRTQAKLTLDLRTSMIIDPENGKLPPVTPEGQTRAA